MVKIRGCLFTDFKAAPYPVAIILQYLFHFKFRDSETQYQTIAPSTRRGFAVAS